MISMGFSIDEQDAEHFGGRRNVKGYIPTNFGPCTSNGDSASRSIYVLIWVDFRAQVPPAATVLECLNSRGEAVIVPDTL